MFLPLVLFLAAVSQTDELKINVYEFAKEFNVYVHDLFGCRDLKAPINTANCSQGYEEVNYAAFKRARERAKVLFSLKDKD